MEEWCMFAVSQNPKLKGWLRINYNEITAFAFVSILCMLFCIGIFMYSQQNLLNGLITHVYLI